FVAGDVPHRSASDGDLGEVRSAAGRREDRQRAAVAVVVSWALLIAGKVNNPRAIASPRLRRGRDDRLRGLAGVYPRFSSFSTVFSVRICGNTCGWPLGG